MSLRSHTTTPRRCRRVFVDGVSTRCFLCDVRPEGLCGAGPPAFDSRIPARRIGVAAGYVTAPWRVAAGYVTHNSQRRKPHDRHVHHVRPEDQGGVRQGRSPVYTAGYIVPEYLSDEAAWAVAEALDVSYAEERRTRELEDEIKTPSRAIALSRTARKRLRKLREQLTALRYSAEDARHVVAEVLSTGER